MAVEILESCMVKPSDDDAGTTTPPMHVVWLSNLDLLVARSHTPTIYVYRRPPSHVRSPPLPSAPLHSPLAPSTPPRSSPVSSASRRFPPPPGRRGPSRSRGRPRVAGGGLHDSLGNVLPVLFMVNSEFPSTVGKRELVSAPSLVSTNFFYRGATGLLRSELWYTATFQRLESRPNNPAQGVTPPGSTNPSVNINDNSLAETYHLVSRPPPYDTDPRYARVQREGLVSRREKSINLAQEESLALRRNGSSSGIEHLAAQKKRSSTENEGEYKVHRSESTKSLSAKAYSSSYAVVASEDEDVCPTCLEEYTPDNPKIITKCCHHFHLGCIYEWMERSDTCPICGKEMEFCESP